MKMKHVIMFLLVLLAVPSVSKAQDLQLNDREYFERQGVNVLVFSNSFNGGFNDEKNSGIEIIHHGVRAYRPGRCRPSEQHARAMGSRAADDRPQGGS